MFTEPTKPIRSGEDIFSIIDDTYAVDTKYDGWRLLITKESKQVKCVSRKNVRMDIPDFLHEKLKMSMPDDCTIDCEWINKSRIKSINQEFNLNIKPFDAISVFDIIMIDGKSTKKMTLKERRSLDFYAGLQCCYEPQEGDIFKIPSVSGKSAIEFYEKQKTNPLSEGVVIKKLTGTIGSNWYKVKFR